MTQIAGKVLQTVKHSLRRRAPQNGAAYGHGTQNLQSQRPAHRQLGQAKNNHEMGEVVYSVKAVRTCTLTWLSLG